MAGDSEPVPSTLLGEVHCQPTAQTCHAAHGDGIYMGLLLARHPQSSGGSVGAPAAWTLHCPPHQGFLSALAGCSLALAKLPRDLKG